MTVAMALQKNARARVWEHELNYTATIQDLTIGKLGTTPEEFSTQQTS